jgi:hypothetical protein
MADRNISDLATDAARHQLVGRLRETLIAAGLDPTGGADSATTAVLALLELAAQIIATAPPDTAVEQELVKSGAQMFQRLVAQYRNQSAPDG